MNRRRCLRLAAGALALPAVLRHAVRDAWAQAYPARPVRILVGTAAGGPQDVLSRLIGQWLSERLGQSFVIDNRPGAAIERLVNDLGYRHAAGVAAAEHTANGA